MPSIHENLRQLRRARNLTQEDVADRLGFARQTISSYESGRTQPDVETLSRLAEVYDADIRDVLYGAGRSQRMRRIIRNLAVFTLIVFLALGLLQAALLWTANAFFQITPGPLDLDSPVWQAHTALMRAHERVEALYMVSFTLLAVARLVLVIPLEKPLSPAVKLKSLGLLALGAAATNLPWAFADPVFGLWNYCFAPCRNLALAALLFGLSFAGEWLYRRAFYQKI
ncbi:MAG TPA: helix-turn-helix transcriptional regulator [Clostridia bacterium]|nr:helix-turn-helix transcriptional regulator [Clostridia bacterium]